MIYWYPRNPNAPSIRETIAGEFPMLRDKMLFVDLQLAIALMKRFVFLRNLGCGFGSMPVT
ncbi:hypothetical protein BOTBODRAFT_399195 [Botryobasidium botryosum FD-172 SS1]|uniref:Uncharacterized protein n=1 Tax=Botryobasidium botryosum (strain FD-172 SS1) TaxID=930990 RepID=A0A067MN00_BOTB1|nr:hypothetical protein BOTBODRAFT_399195 [Botryobasidium botryosum FD-172 SS1]